MISYYGLAAGTQDGLVHWLSWDVDRSVFERDLTAINRGDYHEFRTTCGKLVSVHKPIWRSPRRVTCLQCLIYALSNRLV
jgi:hypothetical protein